ncbi:LytTR family DNA-binding domain-containing protein [Sphingosinicella sp. LHD-64]|uniref:LytTR family DNA-binding domain-containing protein n=1 Tax=Sphingosinicella sp. LHD-64 TaxID=3072139 RepID=UPI00280DAA9B|nr:LytTR family DNA-binding domain-containing protein [Sphingosinicella sp. LHD-64]MDQ8755224.1 LytTR family DNA-binding domain-containing protein [Sphingosinicella sp. LHD-64]
MVKPGASGLAGAGLHRPIRERANGFAGRRTVFGDRLARYDVVMFATTMLGRDIRGWAIRLAIYGALGVFMGLAGPFGSYFNDSAPTRIAYWTASTLMGCIGFDLLIRWSRAHATRRSWPTWMWMAGIVLLATIPLALATRTLAVALWPFLVRIGWIEWYGQSLLISTFCTVTYVVLGLHATQNPHRNEDAGLPLHLPLRLGRDLICLQMEDHYVRVHTRQGSDLVLMPLGQAIARLDGVEGMQIHRSWWVARRAVTAVVEDGRNVRLRLMNGIEAPVSRANVSRLRAAGWLPSRDEIGGQAAA